MGQWFLGRLQDIHYTRERHLLQTPGHQQIKPFLFHSGVETFYVNCVSLLGIFFLRFSGFLKINDS